MCGVVGMVGYGKVAETLITGLEKLEYRGYDSAGIFTFDQTSGQLNKEIGRIAALKSIVDLQASAQVGIGHTRWATHGPATKENAHPHLSSTGRFVLVHNGVIENYKELKSTYLADVTFHSQTDTEVAVMLVEYFALKEDLSTEQAFLKALTHIQGSYAFGLIDTTTPDVLYAAKNKSPLLVGLSDDCNLLASDAMATIHLTQDYLEIKDKEMVILTAENVTIKNFAGDIIERAPFTAELDASDLEKGAYPFYMIKEIEEQPAVMRRLIQAYKGEDELFELSADLLDALKLADRLYVVACGTSYHAGWVGKSFFEKLTNKPVECHLASEFAYDMPILSENPFFIFLTQSGETADSRQALVRVNELAHPSLTITNVKGSTLSREATYTLLLHAGPEIAVASTKAYTAQIAVMAIVADALRASMGIDSPFNMVQALSLISNAMDSILSEKERIETWVNKNLMENRNAFYIGRLSDYYVAMEAALKLKEITYIQTEAFAAGELKHGTIALIEEGTPVFGIITNPVVASHTRGNIEEVKARGAHTMTIVTQNLAVEGDQFVISNVEPLLSPLVSVLPTQLISYYTALGRGLDVDKPRNLAKSVTVE